MSDPLVPRTSTALTPSTRRYLFWAGLACGPCLALSWSIARAMHQLQHSQQWSLWLPVNRTSLYFFPLAFTTCAVIAWRSGRGNRTLAAGAALAWIWEGMRAWYWAWVGTHLGDDFDPATLAGFQSEHPLPGIPGALLTLAAITTFVLGMRRSLKDPEPPPPPLQRADGVDRSQP